MARFFCRLDSFSNAACKGLNSDVIRFCQNAEEHVAQNFPRTTTDFSPMSFCSTDPVTSSLIGQEARKEYFIRLGLFSVLSDLTELQQHFRGYFAGNLSHSFLEIVHINRYL